NNRVGTCRALWYDPIGGLAALKSPAGGAPRYRYPTRARTTLPFERSPLACSGGVGKFLFPFLGRAPGCPRRPVGELTLRRIAALPLSVTRTTFSPHPPEKVWRALTERRQLSHWLLPTATDIRPEPGFRFRFTPREAGPTESIACEVVDAEPGHHLSFTWR